MVDALVSSRDIDAAIDRARHTCQRARLLRATARDLRRRAEVLRGFSNVASCGSDGSGVPGSQTGGVPQRPS